MAQISSAAVAIYIGDDVDFDPEDGEHRVYHVYAGDDSTDPIGDVVVFDSWTDANAYALAWGRSARLEVHDLG
jgi:hypothetical protein